MREMVLPTLSVYGITASFYSYFLIKSNEIFIVKIILLNDTFLDSWGFSVILALYLLLLFGGALYFIMLSNYRSRDKMQRMRSDWSVRLHNNIGNDLSSVLGRVEMLKEKFVSTDPKATKNLDKIQSILEDVSVKLRFVFDILDPDKNTLKIVFDKIHTEAKDMLSAKNITLDYKNELNFDKEIKIDVGRIDKLYLALKEVIGNIAKWSEATEASIHILQQKKGIRIEIQDNGKGFDPDNPGKSGSNGLKNLKNEALKAMMDMEIRSKPGEGTKVSIMMLEL